MVHYVHPGWETQLIKLVNESTDVLKLKSRIYLRRMRIQEQTGILISIMNDIFILFTLGIFGQFLMTVALWIYQ